MYPFRSWSYARIVDRLDSLLAGGYDIESVVASAQTLEQAFKRILVRQMNVRRLGFRDRNTLDQLAPLVTTSDRDRSVKALASLGCIEKAWATLAPDTSQRLLSQTVDAILGVGGWTLISAKEPQVQPLLGGEKILGLFGLRHKLVHGWYLPPKNEIAALGHAGVNAVRDLLHPSTGLAAAVAYDPFRPIPRFRPQPTA